jgi:hypothetical protein
MDADFKPEVLENSWFAERYRALPASAAEQLRLASLHYADSSRAETHLLMARMMAPHNPAIKVAEYRFYFYQARWPEALRVAEQCMAMTALELGFPLSWRLVSPQHGHFESDEPAHRFYLFCLKAYAYLLMRLQRLQAGREAAEKLMQLDPANKVGGQLLLDVLDRADREAEDD